MGDSAQREKLFAAAPAEVLARDTIRARHALLLVEQHRFDAVTELLNGHRFKPWEGGQIIREIFVATNLEKGRRALDTNDYLDSERAFRQALEYPVNLGVGKPDKPHDEEAWYWLAVALDAEGNSTGAREAWRTAVEEGRAAGGTSAVFAAAVLQKLGHQSEAETLLAAAISPGNRRDASAQAFYVAGLAERFRNHPQAAQAAFRNATQLDPLLWQARFELERNADAAK
jgi:tetratricopeptide (TPR) repeat protein